MNLSRALLNDHVRSLLASHPTSFGGSYDAFEPALQRALAIYEIVPDEISYEFVLTMNPWDFGQDIRGSIVGLIAEHAAYCRLIAGTYGHKLRDLATGIVDGLNCRNFRTAAVCCRTLYEEAAAATYYGERASLRISEWLSIPPSTYRLKRLLRAASTEPDEFKNRLKLITAGNKELRKWYHARKIDWQSSNPYRNFRRNEKHGLYPGFYLSAFKPLEWQVDKPAPFYYALLCDATHANADAAMLYVETIRHGQKRMTYTLRKEPLTDKPYRAFFDMICRPTIECVAILDNCIAKISEDYNRVDSYLKRLRAAE